MGRIDVHHHFFPPDLDKRKLNQKNGWITPAGTMPWSPQVSLIAMDAADIDIAILSLPALSTGSVSEENRAAARNRNLFVSGIVQEHPTRFGFFATLPFLDDVEGEPRWDKRCYILLPNIPQAAWRKSNMRSMFFTLTESVSLRRMGLGVIQVNITCIHH